MAGFLTSAITWDLLDCAVEALSDGERPEPGLVVAVPGADPVWDDCCEGMLYARVIGQYPTSAFPNQIPVVNGNCGAQKVAYLGLGVIRCQSGLYRLDSGGYPTATEQSDDHAEMLLDAQALFDAICCFDGVAEAWQPLGPDGGCFGGEWTLWKEL